MIRCEGCNVILASQKHFRSRGKKKLAHVFSTTVMCYVSERERKGVKTIESTGFTF